MGKGGERGLSLGQASPRKGNRIVWLRRFDHSLQVTSPARASGPAADSYHSTSDPVQSFPWRCHGRCREFGLLPASLSKRPPTRLHHDAMDATLRFRYDNALVV